MRLSTCDFLQVRARQGAPDPAYRQHSYKLRIVPVIQKSPLLVTPEISSSPRCCCDFIFFPFHFSQSGDVVYENSPPLSEPSVQAQRLLEDGLRTMRSQFLSPSAQVSPTVFRSLCRSLSRSLRSSTTCLQAPRSFFDSFADFTCAGPSLQGVLGCEPHPAVRLRSPPRLLFFARFL